MLSFADLPASAGGRSSGGRWARRPSTRRHSAEQETWTTRFPRRARNRGGSGAAPFELWRQASRPANGALHPKKWRIANSFTMLTRLAA
jgi:hypothetical protein